MEVHTYSWTYIWSEFFPHKLSFLKNAKIWQCHRLHCFVLLGDKMAVKDAEEMIEEADQNGDGRIDYKGTCLRHKWPPTSTKWRHKQLLIEPLYVYSCHFVRLFVVFKKMKSLKVWYNRSLKIFLPVLMLSLM